MKRPAPQRRRPVVQITLARASRLYRLVTMLESQATSRDTLLESLSIGLRTFYRELDLLKKCGIKVRREGKSYVLRSTMVEAEARLPFPDPQLSFAEMAELARLPGDVARRLDEIYKTVVNPPAPKAKKGRKKKGDA
jgi:predicted DNA-binding transcriptional regulator YafY